MTDQDSSQQPEPDDQLPSSDPEHGTTDPTETTIPTDHPEPTDPESANPDDGLKVIIHIREGLATIGIQQPNTDPVFETVDNPGIAELMTGIPDIIERARTLWHTQPRYPTHQKLVKQRQRNAPAPTPPQPVQEPPPKLF